MLSLSVNTNNQVTNTGVSYDASGDVTNDGVYTYAWNAEQHLKSAASVTYTYDGDLRRVEKSSGTLYWYSPAGVPLAETDTSGNTLNEYVFFGSARVARRDSSGNVYYYFEDHLGTATTLSNASGVLCYDADFLPFGYERAYVTSCAQNYKFTGLERDGETGLDHTLNREYDSSLGRWLTPDPKRGDTSNPQSLNRYAYVLNNPIASVDPLGLDEAPEPGSAEGGSIGGTGGPGNPNYPCANIVVAGGHRPHVHPCGAGGGSRRPSLSALLAASEKRVKADLQKPQCAALFRNPSACQAELSNVTFANLKPLEFTSTNGGAPQPVAGYDTIALFTPGTTPNVGTNVIELNTNVNWQDPSQTAATLNGQPRTDNITGFYQGVLGATSAITASQFMDFTILHELEHYDFANSGAQGSDPSNETKNMTDLWNDCVASH
jgi:RHS repeat-associated protein